MDIRLDIKAVAPTRQPLADVVAAKAEAVPHHQFVDASQRVLVQQREVPHHLVIGIRHRVELAVPKQLAQHQVRVDVFMKPIEVAAKSPLQADVRTSPSLRSPLATNSSSSSSTIRIVISR